MKASVLIGGGRLTKDVTAIFGADEGSAKRALFTVAVNSYFKSKEEKKQKTDWIPCIAWGGQASLLEQYGKKGRLVALRGTLETYQKAADTDGNYAPTKVYVRVSEIEFLDKKVEVKTGTENKTENTAAGPTADEVAAAMLKQINAQKNAPTETAEAGVDLEDLV